MKISEILTRPRTITFFVLLVAAAFAAEPLSFSRAWNQGRSAMLAIVPLVGLELWAQALRPVGRRRAVAGYSVVVVALVYYATFAVQDLRGSLVAFGVKLGIDPLIAQYSWVWGIDYTVTSLFLLALVILLSNPRVITPFIYTVGMACFLYIDVLLPYNSLGPFQDVVPYMLQAVASVLNAVTNGHASASGNILQLTTGTGAMNLQVFWPSAGLQGMVIGVLAVGTICVKLETGWKRGTVYMVVGVIGSFLVNMVRIVLLAFYAMGAINDPKGFERFHSVAGELVFIPWILLFILLIVRHELGLRKMKVGIAAQAPLTQRTAAGRSD